MTPSERSGIRPVSFDAISDLEKSGAVSDISFLIAVALAKALFDSDE